MKIIERKSYLKSLQNVRLTPDIKVVTGVRRAGKSELIRTYMGWLKKHDKKANIIFVDFTLLSAEPLQEYHALHDYIEQTIAQIRIIMSLLMRCSSARNSS